MTVRRASASREILCRCLLIALGLILWGCGDSVAAPPTNAQGGTSGAAGSGGSSQDAQVLEDVLPETGVEDVAKAQAASPQFSLPGGHYEGPQQLQITCATPGATIHYTVDGNAPNDGSPVYGAPVELKEGYTTEVRAYSRAQGFQDSPVVSATYIVEKTVIAQASAPLFTPPGGLYPVLPTVTLSSSTPGVEIHYTSDGTEPSSSSPLYAAPIPLTYTTTLKAIARDPTKVYAPSPVSTATYALAYKSAMPVFSVPSGTYEAPLTVGISCATPGYHLWYTTDGSEPTTSSTEYVAPLVLNTATTVLKVICTAPGFLDSDISTATYDLRAATPVFDPPGGYPGAYPVSVTITSATPGAEIHYTIHGLDPTPASELYSGPVTVSCATQVKAIALANDLLPSAIGSAIYQGSCDFQATPPTADPKGGSYCDPVIVTLAAKEPGALVVYTLDGTLPSTGNGSVYSGPLTLTTFYTVLNAITTAPGYLPSNPTHEDYVIGGCLEVSPVALSPIGTSFANDVAVTLSTATAGATICYTTDATEPFCSPTATCQKGQTYGGVPVAITKNGTVLAARACQVGMSSGQGTSATYALTTSPVSFSPTPGAVPVGSQVLMSSLTVGAEIRYRTDGVDPDCGSGLVYGGPVALTQNTTFRAIVCKPDYATSPVGVAAYTVP